MTLGRIMHMYGDKPPLYALSVWFYGFGCGWLVTQARHNGKFSLESILVSAFGLFIVVHIVDAIIKSLVFVKEHFRLSLKVKCK